MPRSETPALSVHITIIRGCNTSFVWERQSATEAKGKALQLLGLKRHKMMISFTMWHDQTFLPCCQSHFWALIKHIRRLFLTFNPSLALMNMVKSIPVLQPVNPHHSMKHFSQPFWHSSFNTVSCFFLFLEMFQKDEMISCLTNNKSKNRQS